MTILLALNCADLLVGRAAGSTLEALVMLCISRVH